MQKATRVVRSILTILTASVALWGCSANEPTSTSPAADAVGELDVMETSLETEPSTASVEAETIKEPESRRPDETPEGNELPELSFVDATRIVSLGIDKERHTACLLPAVNEKLTDEGRRHLAAVPIPVRDNVTDALALSPHIGDIASLNYLAAAAVDCLTDEELHNRIEELSTAGPRGSEPCVANEVLKSRTAMVWIAFSDENRWQPIAQTEPRGGTLNRNWQLIDESASAMPAIVERCSPIYDGLAEALVADGYEQPLADCLETESTKLLTDDQLTSVGFSNRGISPHALEMVWDSDDPEILPEMTKAISRCGPQDDIVAAATPDTTNTECILAALYASDYALVPLIWGTTNGEQKSDPRIDAGVADLLEIRAECL